MQLPRQILGGRLAPALLLLAAGLGCWGCSGGREQAQLEDARRTTKAFARTLKLALLDGLAAGTPGHALTICREQVPDISRRLQAETGWEVGRTSLKIRNQANAPDAWERQVLERFEEARAQGRDPAELEFHEVVLQNGHRFFRYLKAIPTGQMCLQCHGPESEIATDTRLNIQEFYPDDQATDFRVGDIRGAFSLRKPF